MEGTDRIVLPGTDADGVDESVADDGDKGVFYNLAGQRVATPRRGVYVKNHKKVLVW